MTLRSLQRVLTPLVVAAVIVAGPPLPANACPFCTAESRTLTEEMNDASVVVIARLVEPSEASEKLAGADVPYGFVDPETGAARFRVERVVIGHETLQAAAEFEAVYFGTPDQETLYLVRGIGSPPEWAPPLPLSDLAAAYVPKLVGLPESGGERVRFFLDYLQHEDPLLAQDAYDEFARSTYQDLIDIRAQMDRDKLLGWIGDPLVSPSRRRLYLTMLGVCGEADDVARLEAMLTSDSRVLAPATERGVAVALAVGGGSGLALLPEAVRFSERQRKLGLDAMIACYLTLNGKHGDASSGLDLIDSRFLKDPQADYSHVYATLQALRFLAEEQQELIPLSRVLASARLLLDSPDFADQVIPDLARWEDWSVLDRLAEMFRRSVTDQSDKYVREPIITYLDVAAELPGDVGQRAAAALVRLEPLDPDAVRRARSLRSFGFLAQARSKAAPQGPATLDGIPAMREGAVRPADLVKQPEQESTPTAGQGLAAEDDSVDDPEPEGDPQAEKAKPVTLPAEPVTPPGKAPAGPAAGDEARALPAPPSRLLLLAAPLLGAALCGGVFWTILRGGLA